MQIELRNDRVIIDGYVNAVGRDSRPIRCQTGDFVEQVEPGVFRKALSRAKNVELLLNHRKDRRLGSIADGSLTLTEDNIGLRAHAEVTDAETIQKARNNQLTGWSFGMYVNDSEMEQRSNTIPRRRLKDIDIFEVSVIDNTMLPCYAGTSVECRAEGEDALLETRAFDDTVEITESLSAEYYSEREKQLEQLRAECQWADAEKRLEELRYNPYHDPTNGRFTSGSGNGYSKKVTLMIKKGQKSNKQYIVSDGNGNNYKYDPETFNKAMGLEADLDYASMKAHEYGSLKYGGTLKTRELFNQWNDEVKRLSNQLAKIHSEHEFRSCADEYEKQLALFRAQMQWDEAEKRLWELRYNPYHDPTNGLIKMIDEKMESRPWMRNSNTRAFDDEESG